MKNQIIFILSILVLISPVTAGVNEHVDLITVSPISATSNLNDLVEDDTSYKNVGSLGTSCYNYDLENVGDFYWYIKNVDCFTRWYWDVPYNTNDLARIIISNPLI